MTACKKCGKKTWFKMTPVSVERSRLTLDGFRLHQFKCLICKTIQSEQRFRMHPPVLSM